MTVDNISYGRRVARALHHQPPKYDSEDCLLWYKGLRGLHAPKYLWSPPGWCVESVPSIFQRWIRSFDVYTCTCLPENRTSYCIEFRVLPQAVQKRIRYLDASNRTYGSKEVVFLYTRAFLLADLCSVLPTSGELRSLVRCNDSLQCRHQHHISANKFACQGLQVSCLGCIFVSRLWIRNTSYKTLNCWSVL